MECEQMHPDFKMSRTEFFGAERQGGKSVNERERERKRDPNQ